MEYISLKKDGRTAEVLIQRPPANALSGALVEEIDEVLSMIEEDEEIRVVLIHGEGRFFSAGADIKEFTTLKTDDQFSELSERGQRVFER
ncbi:MAG TPA: enoyl-CoA hydratase-related protein, partial [Chondromyces sp.]|nr:enoyl-CoA hydratase-related protein [Chondromyces sp.]